MRKTWIFPVVAVAVLALVGTSVLAASQYRSRPLDRQNLGVIVGPRTTRATDFAPLAGWGPSDSMHVDARGGIAATISVTVSGGPVEFHLFLEDADDDWAIEPMRPNASAFDPGAGAASTSFTFVRAVPPGDYTVNIAWRSVSGSQVTVESGSLVVQYGAA